MGTIVGINDYDPLRWPNSKWRNLQVKILAEQSLLVPEDNDNNILMNFVS